MRALVALVLIAACSGRTTPTPPAGHGSARALLYDRIGGRDVIASIVKDFVEVRIVKDKRISVRFASADPAGFEDKLTAQLCEATGGPCKYTGKSMREAHQGLALTETELAAFIDDFGQSLEDEKIPAPERKELIGLVQAMHDDIISK